MKTFAEFLTEQTIPKNVQSIITDLEDQDAKILDFQTNGSGTKIVYLIFVKYNTGDYEVLSITGKNVTKRVMEPTEQRRYKSN